MLGFMTYQVLGLKCQQDLESGQSGDTSKGSLTEEGRATQNVGGAILWAGILDQIDRG